MQHDKRKRQKNDTFRHKIKRKGKGCRNTSESKKCVFCGSQINQRAFNEPLMRGNPDIKNHGKKFSEEYQPTPGAKSEGKQRVKRMRQVINLLSEEMATRADIGGQTYELSYEAELIFNLYQQAKNGNVRAAAIYLDQVNKCRESEPTPEEEMSPLLRMIMAAPGVKLARNNDDESQV